MIYYIFKHSTSYKEIGKFFPQIQEMSPNYDYDAYNSVHALSKCYNQFPQFQPDLNYFILNPKAIMTDCLSGWPFGTCGLLISDKFKNILSNFKLPSHRYYEAKLMYKNNIYTNYFWLHIVSDYLDYINYQDSEFFSYNIASDKFLERIYFNSNEELEKIKKNLREINISFSVNAKRIKFKNDFYKQHLDFFRISGVDYNYYISSALKEYLQKEKITGIEYTQAENLL